MVVEAAENGFREERWVIAVWICAAIHGSVNCRCWQQDRGGCDRRNGVEVRDSSKKHLSMHRLVEYSTGPQAFDRSSHMGNCKGQPGQDGQGPRGAKTEILILSPGRCDWLSMRCGVRGARESFFMRESLDGSNAYAAKINSQPKGRIVGHSPAIKIFEIRADG